MLSTVEFGYNEKVGANKNMLYGEIYYIAKNTWGNFLRHRCNSAIARYIISVFYIKNDWEQFGPQGELSDRQKFVIAIFIITEIHYALNVNCMDARINVPMINAHKWVKLKQCNYIWSTEIISMS